MYSYPRNSLKHTFLYYVCTYMCTYICTYISRCVGIKQHEKPLNRIRTLEIKPKACTYWKSVRRKFVLVFWSSFCRSNANKFVREFVVMLCKTAMLKKHVFSDRKKRQTSSLSWSITLATVKHSKTECPWTFVIQWNGQKSKAFVYFWETIMPPFCILFSPTARNTKLVTM
jgi:hypothetical protein